MRAKLLRKQAVRLAPPNYEVSEVPRAVRFHSLDRCTEFRTLSQRDGSLNGKNAARVCSSNENVGVPVRAL